MDRQIVYLGAVPLETDILSTNKNAMLGLGKLAAATFGTTTQVSGLACTQTSPISMQVKVSAGEIYALKNIDDTAYSSLASDTTHQILKQGVLLDSVLLSCPAPTTSGQAINYLIQATYAETDGSPSTLTYYNSSNPLQAYSGPNNTGGTQNSVRKGVCTVSVKAGVSAAMGNQVTPTADSGYVGLYYVTVIYGTSAINNAFIHAITSAPFILPLSSYSTITYVNAQIANLVNSAPAALDTLNELATALGNDVSFATTVTNALAGKAPLTGAGTSGTWGISITGNAATATSATTAGSAPASDVYTWAKASVKPSYTATEVGLGNVNNTADSTKAVSYANSAGSASANDVYAWAKQSTKPSYAFSEIATKPTTLAGYGITDGGGLGVGQTWQAVTRTLGVTYTNSTGKPIEISAILAIDLAYTTNAYAYVYVDGNAVDICYFMSGGSSAWAQVKAIIPAGHTYYVSTNSNGIYTVPYIYIFELR